jgi:hypothetical protein
LSSDIFPYTRADWQYGEYCILEARDAEPSETQRVKFPLTYRIHPIDFPFDRVKALKKVPTHRLVKNGQV